jgi:peptide-methionine (S)-S-oxide reductase
MKAFTGAKTMRIACLAAGMVLAAAAAHAAGNEQTAIFAGGCFWSMEAAFDDVPGVVSAVSGYTGGHVADPSYEQVSAGDTGHMEAVKVVYDPAKITYAQLLSVFWHHVDPFDAAGQFCDKGPEYRSEIFTVNDAQAKEAMASKADVEKQLHQSTVTKIVPASAFYPAEEYHQQFTKKNPVRYGVYKLGCGRPGRLDAIWGTH